MSIISTEVLGARKRSSLTQARRRAPRVSQSAAAKRGYSLAIAMLQEASSPGISTRTSVDSSMRKGPQHNFVAAHLSALQLEPAETREAFAAVLSDFLADALEGAGVTDPAAYLRKRELGLEGLSEAS